MQAYYISGGLTGACSSYTSNCNITMSANETESAAFVQVPFSPSFDSSITTGAATFSNSNYTVTASTATTMTRGTFPMPAYGTPDVY